MSILASKCKDRKVEILKIADRPYLAKAALMSKAGIINPNEVDLGIRLSPHPNLLHTQYLGIRKPFCSSLSMISPLYSFVASELLPRSRLDLAERLTYFYKMAWVVSQLHALDIVHLDIKPENVTLHAGEPILVDFGSARVLAGPSLQSSTNVTSPLYAPPEISPLVRVFNYGKYTDVWALALTGIFFLTNSQFSPSRNLPFLYALTQDPDKLRLEIAQTLEPWRHQSPAIFYGLLTLLGSMLRYKPESRCTSDYVVRSSVFRDLNASPPPLVTSREPARVYALPPDFADWISEMLRLWFGLAREAPARTLFLAVDLLYRGAGYYTQGLASKYPFRYLLGACSLLAFNMDMTLETQNPFVSRLCEVWSLDAAQLFLFTDTLVVVEFRGYLRSRHLFDTLETKTQVEQAIAEYLLNPPAYVALSLGEYSPTPYRGLVRSVSWDRY